MWALYRYEKAQLDGRSSCIDGKADPGACLFIFIYLHRNCQQVRTNIQKNLGAHAGVTFEPIVKSIAKSFTNNVFCRVVAPTSLEMVWPYFEIMGMGRCCVMEEDCHINKSLPVLQVLSVQWTPAPLTRPLKCTSIR